MKKLIGLMLLVFIGMAGWRVGSNLSSDAISMAIGVLFGVLAGVPAALLVLTAERRRQEAEEEPQPTRAAYGLGYPHYAQHPQYGQQPPVIVLAGQQGALQAHGYPMPYGQQGESVGWPMARPERQFKVVGEQEDWVKE
jgi:hypothetical protein